MPDAEGWRPYICGVITVRSRGERVLGMVGVLVVGASVGLPAPVVLPAQAQTPTGTASAPELFFTTNSPPAVNEVSYSISGGQISVGTARVVAALPAADGLAFAPDGDLIVGGGATGKVFKVHPASGSVITVASGIPSAFHVTVSPDGSFAWTAGLPGQLAKVPLKPFGPGSPVPLRGDDQAVSTIGFTPAGAFYTASTSIGDGNFGTFDPATGTTHRTLTDLRGAHGFAYDPYAKDILLFGSYAIVQIDPAHPDSVVSQKFVSTMAFDQGVTDGQGDVLVASNTGYVVYLRYSADGTIGPKSTGSKAFLNTNLDDLATRFVPVAAPVPSAGTSKTSKLLVIVVLGGLVGAGVVVVRRRRR